MKLEQISTNELFHDRDKLIKEDFYRNGTGKKNYRQPTRTKRWTEWEYIAVGKHQDGLVSIVISTLANYTQNLKQAKRNQHKMSVENCNLLQLRRSIALQYTT